MCSMASRGSRAHEPLNLPLRLTKDKVTKDNSSTFTFTSTCVSRDQGRFLYLCLYLFLRFAVLPSREPRLTSASLPTSNLSEGVEFRMMSPELVHSQKISLDQIVGISILKL